MCFKADISPLDYQLPYSQGGEHTDALYSSSLIQEHAIYVGY